jgi:hypothetical protein
VTHYRGVVKVDGQEYNLNGEIYNYIQDGQYYVNADEEGRQFSSKGERHFAPLIIQKRGGKKMIARPYKERFINPRLRPVDPLPYHVSVPNSEPARTHSPTHPQPRTTLTMHDAVSAAIS